MAASAKATAMGTAGTSQCTKNPTPTTVNITSPIASDRTDFISRNNAPLGMRQPSRNSSGGINSNRNRCGSKITGKPNQDKAAPTAICNNGSGTFSGSKRARKALTTTANKNIKTTVTVCIDHSVFGGAAAYSQCSAR